MRQLNISESHRISLKIGVLKEKRRLLKEQIRNNRRERRVLINQLQRVLEQERKTK